MRIISRLNRHRERKLKFSFNWYNWLEMRWVDGFRHQRRSELVSKDHIEYLAYLIQVWQRIWLEDDHWFCDDLAMKLQDPTIAFLEALILDQINVLRCRYPYDFNPDLLVPTPPLNPEVIKPIMHCHLWECIYDRAVVPAVPSYYTRHSIHKSAIQLLDFISKRLFHTVRPGLGGTLALTEALFLSFVNQKAKRCLLSCADRDFLVDSFLTAKTQFAELNTLNYLRFRVLEHELRLTPLLPEFTPIVTDFYLDFVDLI